jgi:hypothetical protein
MPATVTQLTEHHPDPERITILIAPGDPAGYPITHPYVDTLWLPTLGPSAIAALRLIDRLAASNSDQFTIALDELGQRIGIGGRGATSRAARTIERLCHFRITVRTTPDEIVAPLRLPALSDRQLDRLPPFISRHERTLRHRTRTA